MFNMLFACSLDVLCLHRVLSNVLTMWLRGVCRDYSICSCNVVQMLSLETWKVALGVNNEGGCSREKAKRSHAIAARSHYD